MRRWTIAVAGVFVVATAVFAQRQGVNLPKQNSQDDFIKVGVYRINRHRIDYAYSYKNRGSGQEWLMVCVGGHSNPIQLTGDAIKAFDAALGLGQSVEQPGPTSPFDADARPSTRRGSLPPPPRPETSFEAPPSLQPGSLPPPPRDPGTPVDPGPR